MKTEVFHRIIGCVLGLGALVLQVHGDAVDQFSFNGGIPEGWTTNGRVVWSSTVSSEDAHPAVRANPRTNGAGYYGELRSPVLSAPSCDNVCVSFEVWNQSGTPMDMIQVIATTNNWSSIMLIGRAIPRYREGYLDSAWREDKSAAYIPGITGNPNLRIGFRVIAGGYSYQYCYLRNVEVSYRVSARPENIRFVDEDGNDTELQPGQTNVRVAVDVPRLPTPEDVQVQSVKVEMTRNGVVTTNTLQQMGSGETWVLTTPIARTDAGEVYSLKAMVEYASLTAYETMDDDGKAETSIEDMVEKTVPMLGSVWINELSANQIELAGTPNRVMLNGWNVEFTKEGMTLELGLGDAFTWAAGTNNGVGFETRTLSPSVPAGTYTVTLYNACGIAEQVIENVCIGTAGSAGFTGTIPWNGTDWNWEAASSCLTWENELQQATFGQRNEPQQGFEVPMALSTQVYAYRLEGEEETQVSIPVENVDVSVTAKFSGEDKNQRGLTDAEGLAQVGPIEGTHTETGSVEVSVSATAFGWVSDVYEATLSMEEECENRVEIEMKPSVAEDSFDDGLADYWVNQFPKDLWTIRVDENNRRACSNFRTVVASHESRMSVDNSLFTRGKRLARVSFITKNTKTNDTKCDTMQAELYTNGVGAGSSPILFPLAGNFYPQFENNAWVNYDAVLTLPETVDMNTPLTFAMHGKAAGYSYRYLMFDNLRLSFQDMVTISSLELEPTLPKPGRGVERVRAQLEPWGTEVGVTGVEAWFCYRVNGGEVVKVAFEVGEDALVESTAVELTEGLPESFVEGDVFEYWVEVEYDTDNADPVVENRRESRFYPDNSTVDATTGAWMVLGDYAAVPMKTLVLGVQEVWLNEVCPNGSAHFVELAGKRGVSVEGWSLEVKDAESGAVSVATVPAGVGFGEGTGYGFVVFGQGKDVPLSGSLPTQGVLTLKDAEGLIRYAVSYSATAEAPIAVGVDALGAAGGSSLIAVGAGNPANVEFEWSTATLVNVTPGEANPGQQLVNLGPVFGEFEVEAMALGTLAASGRASDIDKPILLQFALGNDAGEWITNSVGEALFEGLDENTAYTVTLTAQDGEGMETSTNKVVYTLLDVPGAPEVSATAAGVLTVRGSVANLGQGQTAVQLQGANATSAWLGAGEWTVDGLAVNTPYGFRMRGRNGDGMETAWGAETVVYTLANAPVVAPELVKRFTKLLVSIPEGMEADGNPAGTRYGLEAKLTYKNGTETVVAVGLDGQVSATNEWATLDAWAAILAEEAWGAQVDITAVDIAVSWVACNGDGVRTAAGPAANTFFEMTLEAGSAEQLCDGRGVVLAEMLISNPRMSACNVGLEYSVDGAAWQPAMVVGQSAGYGAAPTRDAAAAPYVVRGVETSVEGTNLVTVLWAARTDLGEVLATDVQLRWSAEDGVAETNCVGTLAVLDTRYPVVASVVSAQGEGPTNAETLPFTVTFDQAVAWKAEELAEAVTVENGSVASVTGEGTTWTVAVMRNIEEGEVSLTGIAAEVATNVYGSVSKAWSGEVAVEVDAVAPTVALTTTAADPFKTATMTVIATFSEAVTGFEAKDLTVANGTVSSVSGSGANYTFTVTPSGQGEVRISLGAGKVQDAAGNGNEASAELARTYDSVPPTVVFTTTAADPFNTSPMGVTATFSEPVTGFALADLALVNGTASNLSGSGASYTFKVAPKGQGAVSVSLKANAVQDVAGNANAASAALSRTYDTVPPSCVITRKEPTSEATNARELVFQVVFSEPVTGFTVADVTKLADGVEGTLSVSGSGTTYRVTATGIAGDGTFGISIPAGVSTDAAGNGNTAGAAVSYTVDASGPTVVFATEATDPFKTATITVTTTFSEAVTGFGANDLTVVNGTVSNLTGSGANYTFTVTPAGQGVVSVSLGAEKVTDAAGNGNLSSAVLERTYDSVAPVVTRTTEPISGTNACDMVLGYRVTDASASTLQWQLDGGVWSEPLTSETNEFTVRLSGLGTGEHTVATKAVDAAGNSSAVDTAIWTIDLTAPTCTMVAQGSGLVKGSATFAITFSEAVTGLSASDLQAAVGVTPLAASAITLTGSGATYSATVAFTQTSGTVSLAVPARVCTDVAGNGNAASGIATSRIDGAKPTITNVVADKTRVKTGTPVEITFDIVDDSSVSNVRVGSISANSANNTRWRATNVPAASTLTITAQDSMGNTVSHTVSPLPYGLDDTPPTATISGAPSGTVTATDLRASATVSDADPVLEAQWTLEKDGVAIDTGAWGKVPASKTLAYARSNLQAGAYTLTLKVKDTADNERTVNKSWTIAGSAPEVTVSAGAQSGDTIIFTVQGGAAIDPSLLQLSTDNGLSATLGEVGMTGLGTWTVPVTDLYGAGSVTLTVPAGAVADAYEVRNLNPASASAEVSYSTQAPKIRLRCLGRQLNAEEILWEFESDQALTGLVPPVFTASRGVMNVTVASDRKSATIKLRDEAWQAAVHMPITVTFTAAGVTDEFGNAVSAMDSTAVDENLLIPVFGGEFWGTFNSSAEINARMTDGVAAETSTGSATGLRIRTLTYTFGGTDGAVVRRLGFGRALGVATLDGVTVTLMRPDNSTWSTNLTGFSSINTIVDVPDIVAKKVAFSSLQSTSSSLYINELAVFGCPVAQDATAPVVTIRKLDDTPTDADTVRFEVQSDKDIFLAEGQDWDDVVTLNGLTSNVSVTPNFAEKTFLVTVSGLTGNGTVSLGLPAGFFADAAGNTSAAVSAETYEVRRDTAPITAAFTAPASNGTVVDSCDVCFTLEFSEPVKGFEASDLVLTQGAGTIRSIEALSSTEVYVFVAATAPGATLQLKLKAGSVSDLSGNALAADVLSKTYTVSVPAVTETAITVTSSVNGDGGVLSPAGETVVASGVSQAVTATAFTGYAVKTLTVNGVAVSAAVGKTTYTHTLSNITANQTVVATFLKKAAVTVTATAGTGGSVSPASSSVPYGDSTNVVVTAQPGYTIASVKVGGSAKSGVAGKTSVVIDLAHLTASTTVAATFQKRADVAVSVSAGANGSVSRTGNFTVAYGSTTTLAVTAAPETETMRYTIASITVNGVERPAAVGATAYTLTLLDVTTAQTVVVAFVGEEKPGEEPPIEDNRFLFGAGTIALPAGTETIRFTDFVVTETAGTVMLSPVEADPGATTEAMWLVVQRELGGTTSKLAATIDADGVVEFAIPSGWDSLFVVGVANDGE